jgi:hypothetical protein
MFIGYIKKLHWALPVFVRNLYMPVINAILRVRMFFLKSYFLDGYEVSDAHPMKVVYFGTNDKILAYWTALLLTGISSARSGIVFPVWKIKNFLAKSEESCDLALIELNTLTQKVIGISSGFLLPRWLDLEIDLHQPVHIKQLETIKRRIKKNRLTFERKYTDADLQYFYERMYLPYIRTRHKEAAVVADYKSFHHPFSRQKSHLFFLLRDGEPVAGAIDLIEGENIRMGSMGVLEGRDDLLKEGVIGALYYLRILNYLERKIDRVNLGGTSPVLTDGLTQYKLSFGGRARDRRHLGEPYILLVPLRNSPAVKNVLRSNPFIYLSKADTYRGLFYTGETEEQKADFLNLFHKTACPNIKDTVIYSFNASAGTHEWIEKETSEKVRFVVYAPGDDIIY